MAALIPPGCFSKATKTIEQVFEPDWGRSHDRVETTIKYNAFTFKRGVKIE
jgi:hypothetical protein